MSGIRRGRRHGWERERWKERQEREKKKRERETGMGEKHRERGAGEREIGREIGRETGVGEKERDRDRGEKGVTGEKEKKLQTQKKSCNFILSYFTPQNGVKHDKCRATIHCRFSIRLTETRWERK